jgi:predicted phage-related endonuclease
MGAAFQLGAKAEDRKRYGYRIGSSEVPSILDLDGVGTPVHVWRDKVLGVREPVNERMQWGHIFEPAIAAEWQRRNRCVVDEIGLVAHADKPWHQSTIDRRVIECPTVEGLRNGCGLEVKNVGYSSAERWGRDLPDRILAQIIHQLYVTGYAHMHYACNIGGNMMRQGIVYADREQDLMSYIVGEVDRFRDDYLLTGTEPPWSDSKAAKLIELDKATHPIRAGEASVEDIGWVMEYAEAQAVESAAGKRKEKAKAQLARIANGVRLVLFGDQPAYSYRPGRRVSVDLERLAEKYPQAYADPEVVGETETQTLVIHRAYKVKIKDEETPMGSKHEGHAMGRGIAKGTTAKTDRAEEPKCDVPKHVEGHALGAGADRRAGR